MTTENAESAIDKAKRAVWEAMSLEQRKAEWNAPDRVQERDERKKMDNQHAAR